MLTVGIRELKNRLSFYLKRVEAGEGIKVTYRGRVIALLIPAKQRGTETRELLRMVEEGAACWSGGKPTGALRPVKGRGKALAELIIEARR